MSLLDTIVAIFAPHSCLGCGSEGTLVCADCAANYRTTPERCYRCKKLSPGYRTCQNCRRVSSLHTVRSATVYEGLAKDIVWRLKFHGAQAAAKEMANQMTPLLPKGAVIVHVPTASSRIRTRGYDQARLLSRELSLLSGLMGWTALARKGQHHQVGAKREQRVTQLKQAFRATGTYHLKGAHVVLVDDVLTTGATLEAAARKLKEAGANRVDALVFAQA